MVMRLGHMASPHVFVYRMSNFVERTIYKLFKLNRCIKYVGSKKGAIYNAFN